MDTLMDEPRGLEPRQDPMEPTMSIREWANGAAAALGVKMAPAWGGDGVRMLAVAEALLTVAWMGAHGAPYAGGHALSPELYREAQRLGLAPTAANVWPPVSPYLRP